MTLEMSTKYNPKEVEKDRYEKWVNSRVFKPNANLDVPAYSIVIPPPNVTGKLHLGHAWDVTLQDAIIRFKRMQGFDTLWLPGMDHAGIATQAKVEEKLREQGISRYDLGREKFLEKTWEWKEEYAQTIRSQWAKMGVSVDYDRERFTLDEGLSKAVRTVFVSLYEKGLIYRGEKIINWDPVARTALSDIEVIHKDVEGAFYHMNYPLSDGSGYIEIATTRPETMLGDTAVVVNPNDERYAHLIGKTVILPLMDREIPIIADEYVDVAFGTGAMKVTPAHDPNDFELGTKYHLECINVMNDDATMNDLAGKYVGMDRFVARKQIVEDLKALGLLVKIEKHMHSVGHSERSGAVVEPRLSKQWFVKMESLAKQAIDAQKTEKRVDFYPPRFEQTYLTWMENVHDWCISRQLWWGHQIPAWYNKNTGEMFVGMNEPTDIENWVQDEDVLDTWFSSALWPFSTMGFPNVEASDFKRYFPTSTLVTGYDIIFFWVSRMIFQSLEFTHDKPFQNVLIHGLIRDKDGRKMSKSLGNGIDPMDVIEKHGVDALRWFLLNGSSPGQDVRYMEEKVESSWNFINKIWNASRYALMNIGNLSTVDFSGEKSLADRWILTKLNQTIERVTELFEKFEFGEAGRVLYNFVWDDFCDWYIEMSKETLNGSNENAKLTTRSILVYVLDNILRLLHPIMPFVTEEIWQSIPTIEGESIVIANYPIVNKEQIDLSALESMNRLIEVIRTVRNIRNEVNTPLSKPVPIYIKANSDEIVTLLEDNKDYIIRFCNPSQLEIATQIDLQGEIMSAVISGAEIMLPLLGLIDIEDEIKRLEKEVTKLQKEVERVENKLSNAGFVSKAPENVIAAEKQKGEDYKQQLSIVQLRLQQLKENL